MKDFIKLDFNPRIARSQLRELRYLLDKNKSLSENDDILPFFRDNHQLSAFIGSYHPKINRFNRLAFEYDIFGDFTADLVIGDSIKKSYCFNEITIGTHPAVNVVKLADWIEVPSISNSQQV